MKIEKQNRSVAILRGIFWFGAAADGLIAIEWYLISLGLINLPVHPSFFVGEGPSFRYAMSIGSMFMMGWATLLFWGSRSPLERSGLFLITAVLLFFATISDYIVFGSMFTSSQTMLGSAVKLFLVVLFGASFFYSTRIQKLSLKRF
jgi:hypothetical protein